MTNNSSPNLTLSATDASEMYITNTAGCAADGSWEPYATSKSSWSLAQSNATATVYVKFRDTNLNESACMSDSITHDDLAPGSISLMIAAGNYTSLSNLTIFPSATGAYEMYITK